MTTPIFLAVLALASFVLVWGAIVCVGLLCYEIAARRARRKPYVEPWSAVRADQHAAETERLLLGRAEHAKRQTAADRARLRQL